MRTFFLYIVTALFVLSVSVVGNAQNTWTQKSSLPGPGRFDASGFVINGKAYITCGDTLNTGIDYLNDLWEWDQLSDTWSQKANFPGSPRRNAISFAIGNLGYVGGGLTNFTDFQDFYSYDPNSNSWNQLNNLPWPDQNRTLGFSVNQSGYAVFAGPAPAVFKYSPSMDSWTFINNTPFPGRYDAALFVIGLNAYVGLGAWENDMWQFNTTSETWMQVADYPGFKRHATSNFTIGNIGYVGLGFDTMGSIHYDFHAYDEISNSWNGIANFPSTNNVQSVGFSINGKGYVCTGTPPIPPPNNTLWEYSPTVGVDEISTTPFDRLFPNPFRDYLNIQTSSARTDCQNLILYNAGGLKVFTITIKNKIEVLNLKHLEPGIYIYQVVDSRDKVIASGRLIKL